MIKSALHYLFILGGAVSRYGAIRQYTKTSDRIYNINITLAYGRRTLIAR